MTNSVKYFDSLNYSLGNEDSIIETGLMTKAKSIFSIAGSGARVIPLLGNNPERMTILDISQTQLYFARMRIEAIKALEFDEFLGFWGYQPINAQMRKSLFQKLNLPITLKEFWRDYENLWLENGWHGIGRWESSLRKLGLTFCKLFNFNPEPLFTATSLEEQKILNEIYWPRKRAKVFFKLAANKFILNKYLYDGHLLTPGYEYEQSTSDFLLNTIVRLFNTGIARENFFLQWIFLGKVKYFENILPETNLHIFNQVKESSTEIEYCLGDAVTFTSKRGPYDAYSFSDIVSYMGPDSMELLLKNISSHNNDQIAIFRSFLKHPHTPQNNTWNQLSHMENYALENDRTGVYRFHIYERKAIPAYKLPEISPSLF